VFVNQPFSVQFCDEVNVVSGGGFQLHVVLQDFLKHIPEVRTFRAVTIDIPAVVTERSHCPVKPVSCLFDLGANSRQIGNFQGCAVLSNQLNQRNSVKQEVAVLDVETFLREVERLINQVKIPICHSSSMYFRMKKCVRNYLFAGNLRNEFQSSGFCPIS
jgi:hypothetical protein